MGYYDSANLFPFDNEVIEQEIKDQLTTKLDMYQFATADYSLTESEGMVKKIRTYIGTGDVEDVEMGEGNTQDIGSGFVETDYRVKFTQGRFPYYDEQAMADPKSIESGVKRLSTQMINDLTAKVVGEFNNAVLVKDDCTWTFDDVVDAIAMLPEESNEGLFLLVNKAQIAALRKNLKDDLKYVEAFVRTGYIGSVCGVPIYESNAVPAGVAYLANKEAVTIFVKEGNGVEQERDANTRKNTVYARKCSLVALKNADKLVKLTDGTANFPSSTNEGLKITKSADNIFKVNGKNVTAGADATIFPGVEGEDIVQITLPNACKVGTYTIKQVNPALEFYKDDEYVEEKAEGWTKEKEYTFAAKEGYDLILKAGKGVATVDVDGEVITLNYNFSC